MTKTVIFDLDGTLADTGADLIAAANACFRGLGHGDLLHPHDDKATAFRGGRAMLRLGFERLGSGGAPDDLETRVDAQFPLLLESYGDNIDTHTVLYDGAADAVAELRGAGYAVGICTNKPEALAELLLNRLGCRDWFASLVGADTLAQRKPDPAPFHEAVARAGGTRGRAVLIGDTETDRLTARAAGVPCVLVTFGPEGDRVAALAPEALLGHYRDLAATVRSLIG